MTTQQTFEFLAGYRPPGDASSHEGVERERSRQTPSQPSGGLAVLPQAKGEAATAQRRGKQGETGALLSTQTVDASIGTTVDERAEEDSAPHSPSRSGKQASGKQASGKQETSKQDQQAILKHLRHQLGGLSCDGHEKRAWSTGAEAIDQLLPHGGLRTDTITEWVAEAEGCGAATLSLIAAARRLASSGGQGPLVVVSSETLFFPPAAIAFGIPVDRILWVRPSQHADLVWSIDQALRCAAVAAVWAHVGPHLDDRDARRFQLAAEMGDTPGLFVRPASTRGAPSFADVRFSVTSSRRNRLLDDNVPSTAQTLADSQSLGDPARVASSHVQEHATSRVVEVTVDRCRGGQTGQSACVQIDDQGRLHAVPPSSARQTPSTVTSRERRERDDKAAVRLASELAYPKTVGRKTQRRRA